MAKPKSTTKPAAKTPPKNTTKPDEKVSTTKTSAPANPAGNTADVSGAEGAQASSATVTQPPGNLSETTGIPPKGGQDEAQGKATGEAQEPTHLIVKAQREGFARAGRRWSAEATTVAIDDFSPEQIEALVAEPMLDVAFVVEK